MCACSGVVIVWSSSAHSKCASDNPNPRIQNAIKEKVRIYLNRAEQIKSYLSEQGDGASELNDVVSSTGEGRPGE